MCATEDQAGERNTIIAAMSTVGVLGVGNMGRALVKGWLLPGQPARSIRVYDKDAQRARAVAGELGEKVTAVEDPGQVARGADAVLVAVKPQDMEGALRALRGATGAELAVVSTAAGLSLERLRALLGPGPALFRIMPNLAVALGEGVVAVAAEPAAAPERVEEVASLFSAMGVVRVLPESLFNAVTAVTGSGPGFMALVLEGLEDGAVRVGMPREVARSFVRQMALGTSRLLVGDEGSAAELKDRVSSPAGTTTAGLAVLEDKAVRGAFIRAIEAAVQRGRELD